MKIWLFLCCCVGLIFAQSFKGEIYFYDLKDKQVFAVLYDEVLFTPLFDKDVNQTSSSFLVLSDLDNNEEIPLLKKSNSWEDEQKRYRITFFKELVFDGKNFQGKKLGDVNLELIESENNIRIKRSLDFLNFKDENTFRPIRKGIVSFEQICQKPILLKNGKLSLEKWYYFYEEDMDHAILELDNFVYDMDKKTFLNLNELYDTQNLKFQELLHNKLESICDECFEGVKKVAFNNNFLLTNSGLRVCYLPYENHYLNENICVNFSKDEIKEFEK